MNDQELKNLWQQQPVAAPVVTAPQLVSAMQNNMSKLRRNLLARDARELFACVFVFILFAIFSTNAESFLSRVGDLIVVASSVFVGWKIIHARRTTPPAKPDATTIDSLRAELHSVRTQSRLLGSILWWYLLPIGTGVLLSVWGNPKSDTAFNITFTVTTVLMYAFIYWLNQRARTKQLLPAESQLAALLHSAETGEPLSQEFMETQTIIAAPQSATKSRTKTILLSIGETLVALLMLGLGYGAYAAGIFMNAIYVFLLIAAFVVPIIFVTLAAFGKIYFGLLTKPFSRESLRYWIASLPSLAFFASCGYLLSIAVVPCQFPNHPAMFMKTLTWTLAALQLVLALMPTRRTSVAFTALYSIGTAFMIWHFIQIATLAPGEKTVLESPMKGVTCVVQGGNDSIINHHYPLVSQRYALDIFKVADDVKQVRDWKIMNDEAGFGETIYSPCSGRVAHVERNHRDNKKGQTDIEHVAGNYITVEISPNHYVLIAHLKRHSPTVKVGDEIKVGQPIAQCGNSGNTGGPHVHIQIQASPDFNYETETYPIAFRHVLRGDEQLENVQAKRNDLLLLNAD
jgi:hypothetical protein